MRIGMETGFPSILALQKEQIIHTNQLLTLANTKFINWYFVFVMKDSPIAIVSQQKRYGYSANKSTTLQRKCTSTMIDRSRSFQFSNESIPYHSIAHTQWFINRESRHTYKTDQSWDTIKRLFAIVCTIQLLHRNVTGRSSLTFAANAEKRSRFPSVQVASIMLKWKTVIHLNQCVSLNRLLGKFFWIKKKSVWLPFHVYWIITLRMVCSFAYNFSLGHI